MNKEEIDEFVDRCRQLQSFFEKYYRLEPSNRVWCAVMTGFMIKLVLSEEDPEGAYQQILDVLATSYEGRRCQEKE